MDELVQLLRGLFKTAMLTYGTHKHDPVVSPCFNVTVTNLFLIFYYATQVIQKEKVKELNLHEVSNPVLLFSYYQFTPQCITLFNQLAQGHSVKY